MDRVRGSGSKLVSHRHLHHGGDPLDCHAHARRAGRGSVWFTNASHTSTKRTRREYTRHRSLAPVALIRRRIAVLCPIAAKSLPSGIAGTLDTNMGALAGGPASPIFATDFGTHSLLVESNRILWLSILTRRYLRHGVFPSRRDLIKTIMRAIVGTMSMPNRFASTYTGDPLRVV